MTKHEQCLLSIDRAISIQNTLKDRIRLHADTSEFATVAGVGLAYWEKESKEYAVCCIVVLEQESKTVIESQYSFGEIEVPYIPGCLAFRELPLVLETTNKLKIFPDLYMFDGNGYLHPRHMGIATHASFYLNKPTIGVAKSYYKINNTEYIMPENEKSACTDIIINGEIYGRVLRTLKDVKPVFVSAGNYIDLDTATEVVCEYVTDESHIPLPTRMADLETHKMRQWLQTENE